MFKFGNQRMVIEFEGTIVDLDDEEATALLEGKVPGSPRTIIFPRADDVELSIGNTVILYKTIAEQNHTHLLTVETDHKIALYYMNEVENYMAAFDIQIYERAH